MRNMFAIAAVVLSATIAAPAAAQSLDLRVSDRIFDPATGTPVSAMLYYERNGRARFLEAFAMSQTYCDASGHQNRGNPYSGYDLNVRGSVRGRGRGSSWGATFGGNLLEYERDRREDVQREAASFRRSFCRDLRRTARRLD